MSVGGRQKGPFKQWFRDSRVCLASGVTDQDGAIGREIFKLAGADIVPIVWAFGMRSMEIVMMSWVFRSGVILEIGAIPVLCFRGHVEKSFIRAV